MTKTEFMDWRNSPVTKEVFTAIVDRIAEAKEVLANTAGIDPVEDNVVRGMIRAFNELLEMSYTEEEDEI